MAGPIEYNGVEIAFKNGEATEFTLSRIADWMEQFKADERPTLNDIHAMLRQEAHRLGVELDQEQAIREDSLNVLVEQSGEVEYTNDEQPYANQIVHVTDGGTYVVNHYYGKDEV